MVKEVNDLEIYQLALSLADEVYRLIYEWNYLDKLAPKLNAFINAIKNKKDHQVTNS